MFKYSILRSKIMIVHPIKIGFEDIALIERGKGK